VAAGAGVTCPAFSLACSALSFASFDFALAFDALASAFAASSSRFCCLRCSFNSPLLIVPEGVVDAVVGEVGSASGVVAPGVFAGAGVFAGGAVVCAAAAKVITAQTNIAPNRKLVLIAKLFISHLTRGQKPHPNKMHSTPPPLATTHQAFRD
jgi:hypothetical protein